MTIHYKKIPVNDFIQLVKNQLSIKNLEILTTDDEINDKIKSSLKENFQDIRWIRDSLSAESITRLVEFSNVIANELIETKEAEIKENIMAAEKTQTTETKETGKKAKKGWVKTTAKLFGCFAAGFGAGFAFDKFVMKPGKGKKENK